MGFGFDCLSILKSGIGGLSMIDNDYSSTKIRNPEIKRKTLLLLSY